MSRIVVSKQLEKAQGGGYLLESDTNGDLQFVLASTVVQDSETLTSVNSNNDGKFEYHDENSNVSVIKNPSYIVLSQTEGDSSREFGNKFVVPSWNPTRNITSFSAYFEEGSGTHTVGLYKNSTLIASVTSMSVGGKGLVFLNENVSVNDIISVGFETDVGSTHSVCHGVVKFFPD